MIKNYLKIAWRNLSKNKLYSAINIFGLTIGLAACLLIGVYINNELGYDKFNRNATRTVRVTMEYGAAGTINTTATTGTKVGPQFKRTFPAVEEYVRTFINRGTVKCGDKIFDEPGILYADPAFFKIFSFNIIEGDAATALDAPDKIVITKSTAKKYFGSADALNKIFTIRGKDLRVSAICDDVTQNSQIKFDLVTQFWNWGNNTREEIWWSANWITYLMLHDKNKIQQLQLQITDYMMAPATRTDAALQGNDYLTYHLEPLTKVHLYSSLSGFEPNGNITYIYMFAIVALLILIIACANYTNLATAQSFARSGEIGMRKVMGASKIQVFMQFIGESFVITCIAAMLALGLSIFALPYFNYITGKQFVVSALFQPISITLLVIFSLLVSFFAGLYPALFLSGMQIMSVLKKGFNFTGSGSFLRKGLIIMQFSVSVFLIIYTVIILQQIHYLQTKNLGYDKDHIAVLPISGQMQQNLPSIKNAFLQVRGVEAVTAAYETPEYIQWSDGITAVDEAGKHEISLNALPVDLDFIKTMKMQLDAGRDFQESDFATMDTSDNYANYTQTYIINETLAKRIGWSPQKAIGKTMKKDLPGKVVGVVKDFNFSSLHNQIGPLLIFLGRDFSREFMLRINGNDIPGTLSRLESTWKERIAGVPFTYHFLDEAYDKLYITEQRSSALFTIAAVIAIVLACLGLFGLAAFTTIQRTKEIGIRRVLGAGTANIVLLVSKNFLQLVSIAILVAVPLSWWLGSKWLEDFAFRISVHAYIFIATGVITILIVLCTVGFHAARAALSNPVKSLRSE